jgi:uncharacterized ferritin-like protein (DUF455 family)
VTTLRRLALDLLLCPDPDAKAAGTRALPPDGAIGADEVLAEPVGAAGAPALAPGAAPPACLPGRPARPVLVPHTELAQRSMRTVAGRAALLHALAHIEFNAINLALDAAWRFAGLPEAWYRDWLQVAREEALHFELLRDHLRSLGFAYGDFPAHNALWEMAEKTRHDVLARVALVPRTLEARGLDASPPIKAKLVGAGDLRAGEILDIILRDEIGHVAIGNRWFRRLCAQRGLDPLATYERLAAEHAAPRPRAPFNLEARRAAGFAEDELARLGGG